MKIDRFEGQFRFLSNFWPCRIVYEDEEYPSVEHAYQAAKTLDEADRKKIAETKRPGDAKKIGRTLRRRPGWEDLKEMVMYRLVQQKFNEPSLRSKLLATRDAEIVEGNTWGDTWWGVDLKMGFGDNRLGKILMKVRSELEDRGAGALYTRCVALDVDLVEDMLKRARIQYTADDNGRGRFVVVDSDDGHVDFRFGPDGQLREVKACVAEQ